MASRRKGRILAFQALYCWEASRIPAGELTDFLWLEADKREKLDPGVEGLAQSLITGTLENLKHIDELIRKHLLNWDFSRLNRVDLAILRISSYALIYQKEMPASIIINEAIDISKVYGTDDSYRFVNGVLDAIRKTLESAEDTADQYARPAEPQACAPCR